MRDVHGREPRLAREQRARDAEVDDGRAQRLTRRAMRQDVAVGEVAVDHSRGMRRSHGVADLCEEGESRRQRKTARVALAHDGSTGHQRHGEPHASIGKASIVAHMHDGGMPQRREKPALALEARERFRGLRAVAQQLDRVAQLSVVAIARGGEDVADRTAGDVVGQEVRTAAQAGGERLTERAQRGVEILAVDGPAITRHGCASRVGPQRGQCRRLAVTSHAWQRRCGGHGPCPSPHPCRAPAPTLRVPRPVRGTPCAR